MTPRNTGFNTRNAVLIMCIAIAILINKNQSDHFSPSDTPFSLLSISISICVHVCECLLPQAHLPALLLDFLQPLQVLLHPALVVQRAQQRAGFQRVAGLDLSQGEQVSDEVREYGDRER